MKIIPPTTCPSCDSTLERVNDQFFCINHTDCPAQSLKKLIAFCKKLKIKGFGEATVNKLGLTDFNDLITLTPEFAQSRGFSEHMSNKLVNTISERLASGVTYNDFLAAVSIPLIGDGAMRKLEIASDDITFDMCRNAGIGEKAATNLVNWLEDNKNNYSLWFDLLEPTKIIKSQKPTANVQLKTDVVCLTGKLDDFKNRNDAKAFLESQGYTVKTSVTKDVTILISEDGKTSSSSYKKAQANGCVITTIKQLLEDN